MMMDCSQYIKLARPLSQQFSTEKKDEGAVPGRTGSARGRSKTATFERFGHHDESQDKEEMQCT